ncbi:MAG TPA: carbohydrate binding family 9 domain-containing protein, partial [Pyrinomonadaceae bacterium]|nr:carbohydrate binding family 9 domain-containing protein [Pyrinomonadaceae bacterium]
MRKGLPLAITLRGAVTHNLHSPAPSGRDFSSQARQTFLIARFFFLALVLCALVSITNEGARAQSSSSGAVAAGTRHLASFRSSETSEGTRVTITSDSALDDYTAYRSADRFHVLIPQAELSAAMNSLRGRGFTDIQAERRGQDLDLSFALRPGATASVSQKFNRLDVTFTLPADLAANVASVATESLAASAQGEKVGLVAAPQPTPDPKTSSTTSSKDDAKPSDAKPAGTKSSDSKSAPAGKPGIVVPPEKLSPITMARFDKPPVIDGKLDESVWQQATVFKDFYQFRPGDNTPPSEPTEVLAGYDSKFLYFAFRAHDEAGKVRATVPKRDQIFDDDSVGMYLDTFNDRRRAYVMIFNPLGVQADGIFTEGNGEDYSFDLVMESKGSVTQDGYVVEVAIPFKSLRYEAGKGKLWGVHFLRQIKRLNNETDS